MTDFAEILPFIERQDANHKAPDYVDPVPGFPLPKMYAGQGRAIEELRQHKSALICSHTGAGKTATFLTMTPKTPTLIIEPRKFLQKQVAAYRNDVIMFGRVEYPCWHADNAADAPCNKKSRCEQLPDYRSMECFKAGSCEYDKRKSHRVFLCHGEWMRYPCDQCPYLRAVTTAINTLSHGGTIICNFGNFWQFMKFAELIIIDEADLFFKEISSPVEMKACKDPEMDIGKMIDQEIHAVKEHREREKSKLSVRQDYALQNIIYRLEFLKDVATLCFSYKKRDRKSGKEKIYVEINPANTTLLANHLFKNQRILVVTATPGEFELPSVSYSIHQRCGIYYVPQGKLTARSLQQQPFLLNNAAKFIYDTSGIFKAIYGSKQFVVHCGNIGYHATNIKEMLNGLENKRLPANEQRDFTILHEKGNLMGTIEKFVGKDRKYLLVASAEYGADFSWCDCQFILKFPYASYDDRLKALERKLGKEKFRTFYTMDAVNRLIQQSGRVGRGWDSFGCTFILDSKFGEIYNQYKGSFPEWFKERLCEEVF